MRRVIQIALVAIVAWWFFSHVLVPIRISGQSMEPTYDNGGLNFINRTAYWRKNPSRGEVVGVSFTGQRLMLLKRIVGLPGESVSIVNGQVGINGQALNEPYVQTKKQSWQVPAVQLSNHEYFVIGDNRDTAQADHVFGTVGAERVVGKILW